MYENFVKDVYSHYKIKENIFLEVYRKNKQFN